MASESPSAEAASGATPARPAWASGRWLGVDVGSVRVGLALSDPHGLLATPLQTLARDQTNGRDVSELTDLVAEHDITAVVVGLPLSLSGGSGPAAHLARAYAHALAARIAPVVVFLVDERMSTVSATASLQAAGRNSRRSRAVIDQAAAVVILESALARRRVCGGGQPPGELVSTSSSPASSPPSDAAD